MGYKGQLISLKVMPSLVWTIARRQPAASANPKIAFFVSPLTVGALVILLLPFY